MPKPTAEQLRKINEFTLTPMTEDECYVFPNLMIDNLPTSYHSIIQDNLLHKFGEDVKKGVGLLLSHDNSKLPVGRSFDSTIVYDYDEESGEYVKTLYGDFYIALGRNTESGMTTDDIAKGVDSGTLFDTSIGFNANTWNCSVCGNDIRSWECPHYPGEKYVIESKLEDEQDTVETCHVLVGEDGVGELLENSIVYAGACDRASIINQYSKKGVTSINTMSKLQVVNDIKNVPLEASIYQFYTKDGAVLMTDTGEVVEGTKQKDKRGGDEMSLEKIITEFKLEDEEGLVNALKKGKELAEQIESVTTELSENKVINEELEAKVGELEGHNTELTTELEDVKSIMEELTATNEELMGINEDLKFNKELAENYRKDLTEEVLTLGVRNQGNLFNKELYGKFLNTLTIEEIKEVKDSFTEEVNAKFTGVRTTKTREVNKNGNEELYRDEFETETEFREYVSVKATEFAKTEGIPITEATKAMYTKYSGKGDE